MGAMSIIFWTLTLLALVKYVLIVLWANDNGEGDLPSPCSENAHRLGPSALSAVFSWRQKRDWLTPHAGGTISLYSLLCRGAKIGFEYRTHRKDQSLARISTSGGLGRQSSAAQRGSGFKTVLETSQTLKRLLFVVVLLGTCAVIADGILTPGVSGKS